MWSGRGLRLIIYLQLVPKVRANEAILLLSSYAFIACTEIASSLRLPGPDVSAVRLEQGCWTRSSGKNFARDTVLFCPRRHSNWENSFNPLHCKAEIEHRSNFENFRAVYLWRCTLHYIKGKGKVLPRTDHEGPEGEYRYSSTLSLTSALDEGGWSTPRPGRFTPGKETRYPLYRRRGGPHGRSGRLLHYITNSFCKNVVRIATP
jgi:hypothetical protein